MEKLKAFFNGEINLPSLKKVVDLKNVSLNILAKGNNSPFILFDFSKDKKTINVTINPAAGEKLNEQLVATKVTELLNDHVQKENKPIFEIEASSTVEDIKHSIEYDDQINFFRGKIPPKDLLALRAAYYIREQGEKKKPVSNLIKSISANHGTRGSNINNLCGRGYFEGYLRPMYEMLAARDNFELSMFTDNYELIINNAPFAYFVNSNQSKEDIVDNLVDKIPFSKRYGQHQLAIHAIGKINIEKVLSSISDDRISSLIDQEYDTDIKRNILTLTIYFKD